MYPSDNADTRNSLQNLLNPSSASPDPSSGFVFPPAQASQYAPGPYDRVQNFGFENAYPQPVQQPQSPYFEQHPHAFQQHPTYQGLPHQQHQEHPYQHQQVYQAPRHIPQQHQQPQHLNFPPAQLEQHPSLPTPFQPAYDARQTISYERSEPYQQFDRPASHADLPYQHQSLPPPAPVPVSLSPQPILKLEPSPVPAPIPAPVPAVSASPAPSESTPRRITLKLPAMPTTRGATTRGAARRRDSAASGSVFSDPDADGDSDHAASPIEEEDDMAVEYSTSKRGRKVAKRSYVESDEGEEEDHQLPAPPTRASKKNTRRSSTQSVNGATHTPAPVANGRITRTRSKQMDGFIESEEEGEDADEADTRAYGSRQLRPRKKAVVASDDDPPPRPPGRYATRASDRRRPEPAADDEDYSAGARRTRSRRAPEQEEEEEESPPRRPTRFARGKAKKVAAADEHDADGYVDTPSSGSGELSIDHAVLSPPASEPDADADVDADADAEGEQEEETAGYALRKRQRVNYAIPPPLEDMRPPPPKPKGGKKGGANRPRLGWSASGADLRRWMGDDSDSDYAAPPKSGLAGAGGGVFAGGAAGSLLPGDMGVAGGPSNMGKLGDAALADADPLGVNQNVTFDEVGGLDDHINSLKEMTLLPLLYPEVFQRFNLTPPRGVLFHGPPGTGKTLVARALAASCRSNGKGISFFMRKGADCLSKWVGEAERQLRLLFDEARACQPSIIFFDEIDGLAPVRSSKQDQVHASIVSTLLALMDGMDGRGQVVVIGATNRPDAVDPALRRPGRFDREFYFPLPTLPARERILRIMTRKWEGWEGENGEESAKGLAKMTKGYGGADIRALCTEAALNAVQRRYPQIYESTERLLLKPETIGVELRDFVIAIKKIIPSSARSTSSTASPLPPQLVPLLQDSFTQAKVVIDKTMPVSKKRTALEEAQWEDPDEGNALDREMMLQSMETLRLHRPRVALHGDVGMGQGYVAAAALHHLEGYHVQSLELGNLMGDSTRSVEAAIVQLFMEAKRNQPSVIYIPSLTGWCAAVTETARSTVRAMLDTVAPTDPILLLAVIDGSFTELPRDVRAWFGPTRENRVRLASPTAVQRAAFFAPLLDDVHRPPTQFPDGVRRKKRILEVLPVAPPIEPRQPTVAELAQQEENDLRTVAILKFRLGPILNELKRKFKRFTKRASEEYGVDIAGQDDMEVEVVDPPPVVIEVPPVDGLPTVDLQDAPAVLTNGYVNGIASGATQMQAQTMRLPKIIDMDLEKMNAELYKGKYLTPDDFLDDIRKIVHNAATREHEDSDRLYKAHAMLTAAEVSIHDFEPQLKVECERMAERERKRRAERREAKLKAKAASRGASTDAQQANNENRRVTRSAGATLDAGITDPLWIERRSKRQRSNEVAADSPASGSDGRTAKRSRLASDDGRDPLDVISSLTSPPPEGPVVDIIPPSDAFEVEAMAIVVESTTSPRSQTMDPPAPSPTAMQTSAPHTPGQTSLELPIASPEKPKEDAQVNGDSSIPLSQEAMDVEREPPPPLPDFVLDEGKVDALRTALTQQTEGLSVEELEQLRASGLSSIWRHRADWDRGVLLDELRDLVQEFVEEVRMDADEGGSPR